MDRLIILSLAHARRVIMENHLTNKLANIYTSRYEKTSNNGKIPPLLQHLERKLMYKHNELQWNLKNRKYFYTSKSTLHETVCFRREICINFVHWGVTSVSVIQSEEVSNIQRSQGICTVHYS